MTRSELIALILKKHPTLRMQEAGKIVSTVFDEISKALAEGGRCELRGFGVFSVRERAARGGRNPRTGEFVRVMKKKVPFFKAGKQLKDMINS